MRKKHLSIRLLAVCALIVTVIISFVTLGLFATQAQRPKPASVTSSTDYPLPTGADPWGTAIDKSGNVWVAVPDCDLGPTCSNGTFPAQIEVFNPVTQTWVANYNLPAGFGQPLFLAIDSQGRVWFPMPMTNTLGVFDPASNTFNQWNVPTASSGPWGVTVDHNDNVWFTEHYTNKIGRFNPKTQTFTEISTPATNSQPYGITVDGSNNIWFTENNSSVALIAEYTTGHSLFEYKIRTGSTGGLTPHLIIADKRGDIWWSEGWVGGIGRLKISQAHPGTTNGVQEFIYNPNGGTHTSGIAVDRAGLVWYDDSLLSTYGSLPYNATSASQFASYKSPSSNAHPHDGLNVDSNNVIWFDEEFGDKLARAIQSNSTIPTPTPGTTTSSPTPTVAPGTLISQDSFQRSNQSLWGTASDGHSWGGDANQVNLFSIANNTGQVTSGDGSSYSAVLGNSATNAQVLLAGSLSNYNANNFGAVLRWTDGNNWYKAYLDGSNLVIQKKVNGTATILTSVAFPATAGTSYTLRFEVSGTTLSAKVWASNTTEPTSWTATTTDSSLQSGYCGIRMMVQGGATLTITSFQALTA